MFGYSKYTRILRRLVKAVQKGNEEGIRSALKALENLRNPVFTELLIGLLSNRENWNRARASAAKALGRTKQPGSLDALIAALGDQDWLVRDAAAEALGQTGFPGAVGPLLKALGDQESSVRRTAVSALGEIGDPGAVHTLIWVLDDKAFDVRVAACQAISRIGDLRAIEPLTDILSDKNGKVRAEAAKALDELGEPQWKELVRGTEEDIVRLGKSKDPRAEKQFLRMLDKWFEPRDSHSLDALGINETNARISAAYALGNLGDPRAVDPLAGMLAVVFASESLRVSAAEALGKIKDPRAVKPLLKALEWSEGRAQRAAAEALGAIKDPRAIEPLLEMLGSGKAIPRMGAAMALGEIGGPQTVESLVKSLGDEEWFVREAAADALGKTGDPRAAGPLHRALDDGKWGVRKTAAVALLQIRKAHPDIAGELLDKATLSRIRSPHTDISDSSDCSSHTDKGIGVNVTDF